MKLPHVTPGPCTSECKASARLGILPVPDMCAHLNDTLCSCTACSQATAKPTRRRHCHPPSTPEGVRGATELQDEAADEVEECVYPLNTDEGEQADKVNAKGVLENLRP